MDSKAGKKSDYDLKIHSHFNKNYLFIIVFLMHIWARYLMTVSSSAISIPSKTFWYLIAKA